MKKVERIKVKPIGVLDTYEGESLEDKIARIIDNNEPISDSVPLCYTERSEGVLPQYNVRADKWDIALEAMDKVATMELDKIVKQNAAPEEDEKNQDEKKSPDESKQDVK